MEDVETRELRYFVAVAEELHFGRAADRLGIAQPPLSRAIRRLEHRLGVELLERTSHGSRLTPAGEVLLAEGRTALDAVAAAARRAQRAGPKACLVLAMKPGGDAGLLPAILAAYEQSPDALPVEFAFSIGDRGAMLRDGRADVGLLHHPQNDLSGLATEELVVERRVVALAESHPLAACDELRMADLSAEEIPRFPEAARPGTGPLVGDVGELMQLVALGRAVALVSESAALRPHRGVVYRPVLDATPATLVVAWAESSRSREVAAFVTAARRAASEEASGTS
ncbi:LysR family transcriptional regulator [Paractinoplanes atraurantiacus]|uniref:DNA-binding transcriptional regulator, LysR family n=1 Tax=Paractinoplanes atraurantiacus TaxID=1036182 RepID=A0A285JNZ1_9ACTN|nr:LysR family transcriptional regulator [Actinoplanes atraurantiacus]SNY62030.1 DNA-binding transcriptional regulator, LysR family [Actinoplanes atraurantiacus]